jgi:hypothetical protein
MRSWSIDWTFLTGIAAIIAAFVAAYQAWLRRASNTATLLLKLDERFTVDMKKQENALVWRCKRILL